MRPVLAFVLAAALAACDAARLPVPDRVAPPDAAEYAVWSVALRTHILESRDQMAVIIDSTWTVPTHLDEADRYGREMLRDSFSAAEALFPRFDVLNARPYPLRPAFSIGRASALLSTAEMKAFFGLRSGQEWKEANHGSGWDRLRARFPDAEGVIRLSRVAFSADGRWALMYFDIQCGVTCGGGNYLGLRRAGDTWRVVADVNLWAS
jgi:hypothetical protein